MTNVAVFNIGTKPIKNRFEFNFNSLFKLCIVPLSLDLKSMLKTLKKILDIYSDHGGAFRTYSNGFLQHIKDRKGTAHLPAGRSESGIGR
jgi:hypothetical protein